MNQEFPVAFRAEDRALTQVHHLAAGLRCNQLDFFNNLGMLIGIADHPTFTDLPFTNFELGLDQGNNVTVRLDQRSC